MTPFAIANAAAFRPPPPPALSCRRYARDVEMVKEMGGTASAARRNQESMIAQFWGYGPGTSTPPGHCNEIAQAVVATRSDSLEEGARLFALLNIAMADAAIVSWDCKYLYNLWRPVTAIQLADTDGNEATTAEPSWTPLLATPPDRAEFDVGSDDLPGMTWHYERFSEAAWESGMSRIYGGIHFMSANLNGLVSGAAIGRYVSQNLLRREQ